MAKLTFNHMQGILAEDLETNGSATVMYRLQDQPHPLFSINELTGVVTVNGTIDRETNGSFVLVIIAYEEGLYADFYIIKLHDMLL